MIKKFLTKRKEKKRFERNYKIIKESGLFDKDYYYKLYPDIKSANIDAIEHYLIYGWREGRDPNDNFDTNFYLRENLDVQRSNVNPLLHYINNGKHENRKKNSAKLFLSEDIVVKNKTFNSRCDKILMFCYINENNALSNYTVSLLKKIGLNFDRIIFITNIENKESVIKKLNNICSEIIFTNIFNPYHAYAKAFKEYVFKEIKNDFEVVLMEGDCIEVKHEFKLLLQYLYKNDIDYAYFNIQFREFESDNFIYYLSKNFIKKHGKDQILNALTSKKIFHVNISDFCKERSIKFSQIDEQYICFISNNFLIKGLLPRYLINGVI
ncbi:TPA: hypothetical protein R5Z05_001002, partial [Campylobacter coli]|nr:hypothetical protein [Campylobacter coli]